MRDARSTGPVIELWEVEPPCPLLAAPREGGIASKRAQARQNESGLRKFQVVEQLHATFGSAAYSSKLSNTFTPRSVALRPLAGLVPVTTRPEVIE